MPAEFLEAKPRDFNPMAVRSYERGTRLGKRSPQSRINLAQDEIAATNEKNGKRVMGTNGCGCLGIGDGRSKSLIPLAYSCKALPTCRSRRWIN